MTSEVPISLADLKASIELDDPEISNSFLSSPNVPSLLEVLVVVVVQMGLDEPNVDC